MIQHSSKTRLIAFKDNIPLIEGQVKEFCFLYKEKYNIEILKGKYVKNALANTIKHYISFLKEFDFALESVDFYRTYAWFGYFLACEFGSTDTSYRALNVAFWRILKELEQQMGYKFCREQDKKEIIRLLQNELSSKSDLGVGKNGLYIMGKFASLIVNQKQKLK